MSDDNRYRAAPVRAARDRAERVQRGQLATAVGDADEARARLDELLAQVGLARQRLANARARCDEQVTAARRVLGERFVARCRHLLRDALDIAGRAQDALADRDSQVDTARHAFVRARAEREVIERHFARWREARRKLAERRAD